MQAALRCYLSWHQRQDQLRAHDFEDQRGRIDRCAGYIRQIVFGLLQGEAQPIAETRNRSSSGFFSSISIIMFP